MADDTQTASRYASIKESIQEGWAKYYAGDYAGCIEHVKKTIDGLRLSPTLFGYVPDEELSRQESAVELLRLGMLSASKSGDAAQEAGFREGMVKTLQKLEGAFEGLLKRIDNGETISLSSDGMDYDKPAVLRSLYEVYSALGDHYYGVAERADAPKRRDAYDRSDAYSLKAAAICERLALDGLASISNLEKKRDAAPEAGRRSIEIELSNAHSSRALWLKYAGYHYALAGKLDAASSSFNSASNEFLKSSDGTTTDGANMMASRECTLLGESCRQISVQPAQKAAAGEKPRPKLNLQ